MTKFNDVNVNVTLRLTKILPRCAYAQLTNYATEKSTELNDGARAFFTRETLTSLLFVIS